MHDTLSDCEVLPESEVRPQLNLPSHLPCTVGGVKYQ